LTPNAEAIWVLDAIDVGSAVFAQPVFAGSHLLVADWSGTLTAYH
jgi:hypothetical protein